VAGRAQGRHKDGNLLPGINNETERKARGGRKAIVTKELETVGVFLKQYRNKNDTVQRLAIRLLMRTRRGMVRRGFTVESAP